MATITGVWWCMYKIDCLHIGGTVDGVWISFFFFSFFCVSFPLFLFSFLFFFSHLVGRNRDWRWQLEGPKVPQRRVTRLGWMFLVWDRKGAFFHRLSLLFFVFLFVWLLLFHVYAVFSCLWILLPLVCVWSTLLRHSRGRALSGPIHCQ